MANQPSATERARGSDPTGEKVAALLAKCRVVYQQSGFDGLSFTALKRAGLYFPLYYFGVSQADLLERLGLTNEYAAYKAARPFMRKGKKLERWTWERILCEARKVRDELGFLPPAGWFQANGKFSLVHYVYRTGHTWEDVRDALGDFQSSLFVESRSGIRWRSHPEASLSNFLYARGIEHTRGERYPDDYSEMTGRAYGVYDLHFVSARGRIDVEIWGDDPGGHGADSYGAKRTEKERFNASNPNFLGLHFNDCFDEERLSDILESYIGRIAPFVFDRPTDRVIQSTHWSNTDELLEYCRHLAAQMPDGAFPTEEWLRKRGKWAQREGPAYNTVSVYIKLWFGGVRNLRQLLGQAHVSTLQWTEESALAAWAEFHAEHGMTANQMLIRAKRGEIKPRDIDLTRARKLKAAAQVYLNGSGRANELLGIDNGGRRSKPRGEIGARNRARTNRTV